MRYGVQPIGAYIPMKKLITINEQKQQYAQKIRDFYVESLCFKPIYTLNDICFVHFDDDFQI